MPNQHLHVLDNESLHIILNEDYACACMYVNILKLITDKMTPPHTFTQSILGYPCPLTLPSSLAGRGVLFSGGSRRNLCQYSTHTKGLWNGDLGEWPHTLLQRLSQNCFCLV